ncbi:uncharacterized protein C8Q71DRAFT_363452 [Rhodofomes roseus]|uniref:Uncharacterized protein n=1 Tax=Rhodofomes roseus TaxID=34475 RepID=A0ABQ8K2G2_9APHY|nr:uncharacterized protein C8Q71DRAFT_363452 [Rhodofomes roseus]KAH9830418.1 hypothetical protein C8Q71DRAFT_363452 [Rhodofomes roseus]
MLMPSSCPRRNQRDESSADSGRCVLSRIAYYPTPLKKAKRTRSEVHIALMRRHADAAVIFITASRRLRHLSVGSMMSQITRRLNRLSYSGGEPHQSRSSLPHGHHLLPNLLQPPVSYQERGCYSETFFACRSSSAHRVDVANLSNVRIVRSTCDSSLSRQSGSSRAGPQGGKMHGQSTNIATGGDCASREETDCEAIRRPDKSCETCDHCLLKR